MPTEESATPYPYDPSQYDAIYELLWEGKSREEIAQILNARSSLTPRGEPWTANHVLNTIRARLGCLEQHAN